MVSKSLSKKCKCCDNAVAWSTKICSSCGVKNPAVKIHHQAVACLLVLLALTLCAFPRTKTVENISVPVAQSTTVDTNSAETAIDTLKVRADLEDYKKKFSAAQNFWNTVEAKLANYSQSRDVAAATDLGQFMKLAQDAAETMAIKSPPEGPAYVREQYQQMNDAIRGVFSYTEKRIRFSLEIVNGSGNPGAAAEKLAKAQTMHQYSVDKFNEAAQVIEKILAP